MDWKLEVVIVPVSDIDRARHFYETQVGFVVDHDTRFGGGALLGQLTPPGPGCSIAMGRGMGADMPPGSLKGLQLVVEDIDAARAQLVAGGVAVSPVVHYEGAKQVEGRGGPWNSFVFFSDPDGNSWAVQERPGRD